ncbi:efflux RND transporter periplasmic adaptor subunit [Flavobacterium cerinum]|uniref:Efflux RND transporter periplasmic adaptor subunit n=1 Tax=Flavobacterium cerinum TaxID=2502784 RepID=A0ABY5J0L7_9FLAO|nr:efflux RND transporter periplasmic adaptor subunit [Flavobacterium cerinum]UUC47301.1 efflux RND transporter periplasmic adaptor subunit [Flavobacterium cerinum]
MKFIQSYRNSNLVILLLVAATLFSCGQKEADLSQQIPKPEVDFLTVESGTGAINKKYPGMIEGSVNVAIKAQVSGYLEAIFVKEGDYVQKGQALFKIKGDVYEEQVNNSSAAYKNAEANLANAKLEVEKIRPLVEGKVYAPIQLKTAEANYEAAKAQLAQAKATLGSSRINADFSLIKAPVSGYISRIPNRIGNLVTPGDTEPLTTLSDINTVFVYFSLSEADYLAFLKDTADNKGVQLILADGSTYEHKGTVEIASGNIDRTTGSIALKAIFPNPKKYLRSGGSARVILNSNLSAVTSVPMASVKDIQDKFFVFILKGNKVAMTPIEIAGSTDSNYFVSKGIKSGDKVALNNIDALSDGLEITPKVSASTQEKK